MAWWNLFFILIWLLFVFWHECVCLWRWWVINRSNYELVQPSLHAPSFSSALSGAYPQVSLAWFRIQNMVKQIQRLNLSNSSAICVSFNGQADSPENAQLIHQSLIIARNHSKYSVCNTGCPSTAFSRTRLPLWPTSQLLPQNLSQQVTSFVDRPLLPDRRRWNHSQDLPQHQWSAEANWSQVWGVWD